MHELLLAFLLLFSGIQASAQPPHKVSLYLQAQYNKTLQDITKYNNPSGLGAGLQGYWGKSGLRPTIDFTADAYLEDDKVLRTDENGNVVAASLDGMVNLFAGASFMLNKQVYVAVTGGPSFTGGQTLFGIKPSFGFYFTAAQRWTGKLSYIRVFNRGYAERQDFSALSIGLGLRLF